MLEENILIRIIDPLTVKNQPDEIFYRQYVHLLFCLRKEVVLRFGPVYSRTLQDGKAFIIYDPDKDIPYHLEMSDESRLIFIQLNLQALHRMFAPESNDAPIFNPENANRKFYEEREINSDLLSVLNQLLEVKLLDNSLRLYHQAKSLEILSLFFTNNKPDTEACPFLSNEQVIRKLKNAKNLLIQNYAHPANIPEIAKEVGLNELQLKLGFREIYGNTPYQFVLDYKLEMARQFLIHQKMQVSEVADKVGYTNVSHFITAFKRKFGLTPKKFVSG